MPARERHNIVIGSKTWSELKALAEKEEKSASELIREAVLMLFEQRRRKGQMVENYDPATDEFSS